MHYGLWEKQLVVTLLQRWFSPISFLAGEKTNLTDCVPNQPIMLSAQHTGPSCKDKGNEAVAICAGSLIFCLITYIRSIIATSTLFLSNVRHLYKN